MTDEFKWEEIDRYDDCDEEFSRTTARLKVNGGYIYAEYIMEHNNNAVALCFVPNPSPPKIELHQLEEKHIIRDESPQSHQQSVNAPMAPEGAEIGGIKDIGYRQRFGCIEEEIAKLSLKINTMQSDIDVLRDTIHGQDRRIEKLHQRIVDMEKAFVCFRQEKDLWLIDNAKNSKYISDCDKARFDADEDLRERIEALEKGMSQSNDQYFHETLHNITMRLERLENNNATTLNSASSQLGALYERLEKQKVEPFKFEQIQVNSHHMERIEKLETKVAMCENHDIQEVKMVRQFINELKDRMDEYEKMEWTSRPLNNLAAQYCNLATKVKELEEWTRKDEDRIYERIEKLEQNQGEMSQAISTDDKRIEKLEQRK